MVSIPHAAALKTTAATRKHQRHYLDWQGIVVGDFHLMPILPLVTDNRYDNSSTREKAQREELDLLAARQHGEAMPEDPLSTLIRLYYRPRAAR